MPERKTKEEVLKEMEDFAEMVSLLAIPTRLRIFIEELKDPPPDLPEVSRSSHYS